MAIVRAEAQASLAPGIVGTGDHNFPGARPACACGHRQGLQPHLDWPRCPLGWRGHAAGFGVVFSNELNALAQAGAARAKLAGSIINIEERITRAGSRMAWVRLSDSGGSYEITCFSEALGRARGFLAVGNSILVTAEVRLKGETLRITAQDVSSLDAAASQTGMGMRVWLRQTEAVAHIRALVDREGRGRGRVVLIPRLDAVQDVEITGIM